MFWRNRTYPWYLKMKNKLLQLYLIGLKGQIELARTPSYLRYKKIAALFGILFGCAYLRSNSSTEFHSLFYPNFLIPQFVYDSRFDHYVYWELSRLARKKPNLFSYYLYDTEQDFIYYVDKQGLQRSQKNNLSYERVETIHNPEFEFYVREYKAKNELSSLKQGNLLIAYTENIHNAEDLRNYLAQKTVNLMDFIRGAFWKFMIVTNFTNYYRYDHLLRRSDLVYEYEMLKKSLNLGYKGKDND